MKVLIVEDDQIVANIYRNKLAVEGFQVEVATDGESGLNLIGSFRPDVLLIDLMLPKVPGVEVIRKVRAQSDFQSIPIIVLSSTYLSNMVQEAWKAGATKCLSKAACTPRHVIEALRTTTIRANAPEAKPSATTTATTTLATAEAGNDGTETLAAMKKSLADSFPAVLNSLRVSLQNVSKAGSESARVSQIQELHRQVHALSGRTAVAGMGLIAQMSEALEALLKELYDKPRNINASTLRTVASAIDFLGLLFERGSSDELQLPSAKILVVDDETISRRALSNALERAHLKSVNVDDPVQAFKLLAENEFDLIFLDVDMPEMNGHELCSKLRNLPAHKKTPVVFVTGLTDFESRANSMISGGNDFIGKPFLFMELAVKSLVYVLRGRLNPVK